MKTALLLLSIKKNEVKDEKIFEGTKIVKFSLIIKVVYK